MDISYGDDKSQFGRLHRSKEPNSKGTVVVIHGGFWRSAYDLSLGEELATDLARRGWDAWNLEYRRVGDGGGWPETFEDVAAGIDKLADIDGLDLDRVVTLGHSAGGHLAAWSASRPDPGVAVTAVISQAGVLDLIACDRAGLGGGAVRELLGGSPSDHPQRYRLADPMQQLPLDLPVWCIHGNGDRNVPPSQSRDYVERATSLGTQATLIEIDGDHFTLIDIASDAWLRTLEIFDGLTASHTAGN